MKADKITDTYGEMRAKKPNKKRKKPKSMSAVLVMGFVTVILLGTALLMFPISSRNGQFTDFITAAFTSVSATCVTGLIIEDTGLYWSLFGQIVIITMIQIGGLGFMTMAVQLSLLIKRSVTPKERMLVAMSYNIGSYESTTKLVRRIISGTFIIEGIGAALLFTQFGRDFGFWRGLYKSIFHSISAFCNAGFDVLGNEYAGYSSLEYYVNNPVVNVTIMLLIILGGIGFIVWSDVLNYIDGKRKKYISRNKTEGKTRRLSVYSRLVLIISAILFLFGTVFIAVFEWNGEAFVGFDSGEKILASAFQSVTCRTAGFASVDNGTLTQGSLLISIVLMFIGGASGSTAGGVKVVTFGILLYTVICIAIGKKDAVLFGRKISSDNFLRASSVIVFQLIFILIGTVIVVFNSGADVLDSLFETVSAVSTVGLTTGITSGLGVISKVTMMCLMFFGRVGILTIAYTIMVNMSENKECITYPDANLLIG